jgi:hypothetical protein
MKLSLTNKLVGRTTEVGETQDGKQMVLATGKVTVMLKWKREYMGGGGFVPIVDYVVDSHDVNAGQAIQVGQLDSGVIDYDSPSLSLLVAAPGNELGSAMSAPVLLSDHEYTCVVEYRIAQATNNAFYVMSLGVSGHQSTGQEFPGAECQRTPGG